MESLFIETEVENKNEALREAGRDLNALGTCAPQYESNG